MRRRLAGVLTGVLARVLAAAFGVAAPLAAARLGAQSIDPPIAVFDGNARGQMVIANPSLFPINFVLEPKSFSMSCNGDVLFAPLDTAHIHLTLSAMSGRITAKQNIRIFYEASADSLPAWFAIIASFSHGAPGSGLSMRLELPQMVYLMQRDRVTEGNLAVGLASYDSVTHVLRVRLENHSRKLTRLTSLTLVSSSGQTVVTEAGPLFPNSARDYEHLWRLQGRPVTLIAAFPGFSITRAIQTDPAPCAVDTPGR